MPVVLLGVLLFPLFLHAKPIRLRNEIFDTASAQPEAALAATRGEAAQPGLVLVQFKSNPNAELRAQLEQHGVRLLAPVPEDAFIARLRGKDRAWLRALPEVEWVGPYKPEHKTHQRLAQTAAVTTAPLEIRVLVAPGSTDSEQESVRAHLDQAEQGSPLSIGTIIRGRLSAARLKQLQQSDVVLWIEPAAEMKLFDESSSKLVAGDGGPNLLFTQSLGYDGSGVTVAVADSGLHNGDAPSMHPDLFGRTPAFFHYGSPGQLFDAADEHSHGTHVAGIIAGNGATGETDENGMLYGLGVAPGASIVAQRIFDGVGNYMPPPSFGKMVRDAKSAGAEIGSNSWGDDTQGQYDLSAAEFDALVRDGDSLTAGDQPYILEFSAGNAGPAPGTIGSPAVGKNVIATGASQSDRMDFIIYGDGAEAMADFSSRGPCADGRIKPDIVAPGTYIASLQSASATDQYAWAAISANYQYQGGTSQAGPHASGAAAVFVQYYRETFGSTPSPALVKAALINSAVDLFDEFGTGPVPNMDEGWGRLDLPALFDPDTQFDYLDQENLLAQAQTYETSVVLGHEQAPFKVTLVYTDVPGVPSAQIALVNDLDLEVLAPDGRVYRGNQFFNGESIPNAASGDRINNVEGVLIHEPIAGEYRIRVRAHNIVSDARKDTGAVDQDFALVVACKPVSPGHGVLSMDREAYRAPDTIRLQVADKDLAGAPSVTVRITSSLEPAGEQVILHPNGPYGAFTGAVLTATGPAASDGKLQVANGNQVTATYFDASENADRTAQAIIDLVFPVISGVSSEIRFGIPHVLWGSSEPATSTVYFGTNSAALTQTGSAPGLTTTHTVSLGRVQQGVTYFYYVVSADEAGNLSTNNNSGAFYTFSLDNVPPLLLVDGWVDDGFTGVADLGGYTNALNQLGIPYETWIVAEQGSPINVLDSHRVVIWRFPEFLTGGWAPDERVAVSNYLHSGGALMVASMELLTRLEEAGASDFIKQVLHVGDYRTDEQGSEGVQEIFGASLDPTTAGFYTPLDYVVYEELWEWLIATGLLQADISDTIFPDGEASTFLFDELGDSVGIRWPGLGKEGPGRLVLLSFPLDAVPMEGTTGNRVDLLHQVMSFLAPGASRYGSIRFGAAAYQVPSVVKLELGDSDLASESSVQLTVRSTSQPAGIPVTLTRSGVAGQFAASFELVSSVSPGPGQLRAVSGDELTVEYFDASYGETRIARAAVDNVPATISDVGAEAEYVDAVVYWNTSEPTDATVLFGESPLLGRTAYSASLQTSHEVILGPLLPERTYYYKVVARDAAGNASETNNTEVLTFTTRTPARPPWSDNMDTGAVGWSTFTDPSMEGGSGNWTLGAPTNGFEETPHSLPNCWGTNLRNEPMDSAECLLISPAIYLDAGQSATLTFWHNYEFTDYSGFDFEFATLQISVNNGPLQDIASYDLSSFGWEQETIDLTPYAGNMVFLVWHYGLLGFEFGPRPGWLVDDVAITSEAVVGGTVQITNNIWQAVWELSGPTFKDGGGSMVVSNAIPGEYLLEFADVPYYQKPVSQTQTLEPDETITFTGQYTFQDANQNGISDAWEMEFFKTVSPDRSATTDSDGDGMTDYEEFVVGTDPAGSTRPFLVSLEPVGGSQLRLEWPATLGQTYVVEHAPDLLNWSQVSSPIQATSSVCSLTVPITTAARQFFRVSNAQSTGPNGLPDTLRLSMKIVNGDMHFTWPSPNHCGYLLESSSDLITWAPASQWIRASSQSTSRVVSGPPGSRKYYRLRAEP